MKKYSRFFETICDDTDYTILRSVTWYGDPKNINDSCRVRFHNCLIAWDEDRDDRVIRLTEALYVRGLLIGVNGLGEVEGSLRYVVSPYFWSSELYESHIAHVAGYCIGNDSWYTYPVSMDDLCTQDRYTDKVGLRCIPKLRYYEDVEDGEDRYEDYDS